MPDGHGRDDQLDAREAARTTRRDRDAGAAARDLMRPGMGKVFKQIRDAQANAAKAGSASKTRPSRGAPRGDAGKAG